MDYQPPLSSELARATPHQRARLLERAVEEALRTDPRPAALWLPEPAAALLSLGSFHWREPFDLCEMAVWERRSDALDVLLDLGFAPVAHAPNPVSPSSCAKEKWQSLLRRCANNGLCDSIARLAQTVAIDAPDSSGRTPLMSAASNGQDAAALLLLSLGANPRARCAQGCGPIAWTAIGNCPLTGVELLERGASLYERDFEGLSPIDHAKAASSEAFLAMLEARQIAAHTPLGVGRRKPAL